MTHVPCIASASGYISCGDTNPTVALDSTLFRMNFSVVALLCYPRDANKMLGALSGDSSTVSTANKPIVLADVEGGAWCVHG